MSDWQAAQHADETQLQGAMLSTLKTATERTLTIDEAMLLAWGAGVSNDFYKEMNK